MRTYSKNQRVIYIRRRLVFRLAALLLFIGISATSTLMLHANAMDELPSIQTIDSASVIEEETSSHENKSSLLSVEPGDTLWTIAKMYGPEGVSVKKYVQQIVEHNDLKSASIQAGQVLKLP